MQPPTESQSQAQPVRVLLVDDQKDILYVMRLMLARQHNYCVETASSGQQALEKVKEFSPDVVISDIAMPEMDGCELMTQLRGKTYLTPFKSIALSGYGGKQQQAALAAGFDVHLEKPVDYDNLSMVINQLAQEKSEAAE